MKRIFALLALVGAVAFGAPAWAEEKPAEPVVAAATAAPAAAAAEAAPAAAAAPAATEAAPVLVPNKGDNAWVMVSAALVILMSIPGLALFYGGLVRSKNMLSVLMQVFTVFALISVLWVVYGYSLAFTEGNDFFGTLDDLIAAVKSEDRRGISDHLLGKITAWGDNLLKCRTECGALVNRYDNTELRLKENNLNLTDLRSKISDVDLAEAASQSPRTPSGK